MKIKKLFSTSIVCFVLIICSSSAKLTEHTTSKPIPAIKEAMYFPPFNSDTWETKSVASLGWRQDKVQDLLDYLQTKNSRSFMILQNGRIVMENYFGGHTSRTPWFGQAQGKHLPQPLQGLPNRKVF